MEEEFIQALTAFLSADNEIRRGAEIYLLQRIKEPLFYQVLFNLYPQLSDIQKQLTLILIKMIVTNHFPNILNNFSEFTQMLNLTVLNTSNITFFRLLAEIILQTAARCEGVWPDFPKYIELHLVDIKFLPLSLYILTCCTKNYQFSLYYKNSILKNFRTIVLNGLKHQNTELQILSTDLFCEFSKKYEKQDLLDKLKPYCDLLFSIAENSVNFDENSFDLFWTRLFNLNRYMAEPFYNLVRALLNQQEYSPHTRIILLYFVFRNLVYVDPNEIEELIKYYFMLQLEVEDIDSPGTALTLLYEYNPEITYQHIKNNIILLITSPHQKYQEVGLCLLKSFYLIYNTLFTDDISNFIDLILSIESFTYDTTFYALSFMNNLRMINPTDSVKVFNFSIDIITKTPNSIFQYYCMNIIKYLKINPEFFERLLEIQPQIQMESVPIYLYLLTYTYQVETNLTFTKYNNIINSIIDIFIKSTKSFAELTVEFEADRESFDKNDEFYQNAFLSGSSAVFIIFFNYFLPYKFGEALQPAFDAFFNVIKYKPIFEIDKSDFSILDLEKDFKDTIKFTKLTYLNNLRPYYEFLSQQKDVSKIQQICVQYDGVNCPSSVLLVEYFNNKSEELINNIKTAKSMSPFVTNLTNLLNQVLHPVSKWLYRIPDEGIHMKYLEITHFCILRIGTRSHDIMKIVTNNMRALVASKHLNFYKENKVEWFPNFVEKLLELSFFIINNVLLKNESYTSEAFFEIAYIMEIFIKLNCDHGHEFFVQCVIPSYKSNPDMYTEVFFIVLLKMMRNNYCNKEELTIINQVVESYMKENTNYNEIRQYMFEIIYRLSKINFDIASFYFQFALDQFNATRGQITQRTVRILISIFLFSAFNTDPEKFNIVSEILPEILSYFPIDTRRLSQMFLSELDILLNKNSNLLTKEIVEAIIAAITRFFSYLNNAPSIFNTSEEQSKKLINMLKTILDAYISQFPALTYNAIISGILPDQPASIEYVLSLLSS